jgi:glycosyltransferase involved in cell wall biosynthesis
MMVSGKGEREEDLREEGFQHTRYRHGGTGWWFGGRRRLVQDIEAWRPDLLHVHQVGCLGIFNGIAAKLSIPLIASVQRTPDAAEVELLKDPVVAMILAPSESVRAQLVGRLGCSRDRVALLPYGLDLDRYPVVDPSPEILRIGAIGRFEPRFGFEVLLDALAVLRDRGTELQATLVGSGIGGNALQEQLARLHLDAQVKIVPGLARTGRILSSLDCYVYPNMEDLLTLGVLKAMACGRPVVASAIGSVTEWIHDGHNGLLVPPGDPNALADALAKLVADPKRAAELGAVARSNVAESNDLRLVGEACHELYRGALRSSAEVDADVVRTYRRLTSVGQESLEAPSRTGQ